MRHIHLGQWYALTFTLREEFRRKVVPFETHINMLPHLMPSYSAVRATHLSQAERFGQFEVERRRSMQDLVEMMIGNDIIPMLHCVNHHILAGTQQERALANVQPYSGGCEHCIVEFVLKWYELANYKLQFEIKWALMDASTPLSRRNRTYLEHLIQRHKALTVEWSMGVFTGERTSLWIEIDTMMTECGLHVSRREDAAPEIRAEIFSFTEAKNCLDGTYVPWPSDHYPWWDPQAEVNGVYSINLTPFDGISEVDEEVEANEANANNQSDTVGHNNETNETHQVDRTHGSTQVNGFDWSNEAT